MADTALRNALSREEDKDTCKKGTEAEAGRDIASYVLMERTNDGYGTENRTLKDKMSPPVKTALDITCQMPRPRTPRRPWGWVCGCESILAHKRGAQEIPSEGCTWCRRKYNDR